MKNLAPEIYRQRLLVEGHYSIAVDEGLLRGFFPELTAGLGVTAYTQPFISESTGIGRTENQGFEAFQPLIESGVALYTWTEARFLSLIIYTCKRFDPTEAVRITSEYFRLEPRVWREF